jgi:1-phosphatidylinositol-4-phosphate 5-kinase
VFKAGQGAGKSGSFFFFSFDNKFLIKTLNTTEKKILLGMLDDYIEHIVTTENKSLLARIYGLFTIKSDYYLDVNIIVMQNSVQMLKKDNQRMTFDMKGSSIKRKVPVSSRFWKKCLDYKPVLKDLNYLEICRDLEESLINISRV